MKEFNYFTDATHAMQAEAFALADKYLPDCENALSELGRHIAIKKAVCEIIYTKNHELTAAQDRIRTLETALQAIIDEQPKPTLPYGKAVVRIATEALSNQS